MGSLPSWTFFLRMSHISNSFAISDVRLSRPAVGDGLSRVLCPVAAVARLTLLQGVWAPGQKALATILAVCPRVTSLPVAK